MTMTLVLHSEDTPSDPPSLPLNQTDGFDWPHTGQVRDGEPRLQVRRAREWCTLPATEPRSQDQIFDFSTCPGTVLDLWLGKFPASTQVHCWDQVEVAAPVKECFHCLDVVIGGLGSESPAEHLIPEGLQMDDVQCSGPVGAICQDESLQVLAIELSPSGPKSQFSVVQEAFLQIGDTEQRAGRGLHATERSLLFVPPRPGWKPVSGISQVTGFGLIAVAAQIPSLPCPFDKVLS